jgi:hypothetical protein
VDKVVLVFEKPVSVNSLKTSINKADESKLRDRRVNEISVSKEILKEIILTVLRRGKEQRDKGKNTEEIG